MMDLSEHFRELRRRLLVCLVFFSVAAVGAFYYSLTLWNLLKRPLASAAPVTLVNLTPAEGITVDFLVACLVAALISAPVFLYHLYAFSAPAVQKDYRRTFLFAILGASLLFFAGAAFAFFIAIPMLIAFLSNYSLEAVQFWSQNAYVSFLFRFEILFGLLFQMPVAAFFLARTGIAGRDFPLKHFRISFFSIFLFSAIVTPPDLFSLFWIAIPMLILFGASILVYTLSWRRR